MFKQFKEFAMRGNVMDMAVGVIIGAAFSKIVNSLVNDILMPPIGFILGRVDFSHLALTLNGKAGHAHAVTINYGAFINTIINFVIVAFALFILIRQINRFVKCKTQEKKEETKDCPYCFSSMPLQATRCPACTSQLSQT